MSEFQTVSECDPGPRKSRYTTPAIPRNPKGIVVRTIAREPVHPVAEFLWPPGDRIGQAHHALIRSISTRNASVRKHCLLSRSPTRQAAGIGITNRGNGGIISDNRRKFIQVATETGTGHSAPDTTANALYIWKAGQALRGGINGKQIWNPGGGRAESLFTAGRRRERRERGAG